jgi:hypothetical protein
MRVAVKLAQTAQARPMERPEAQARSSAGRAPAEEGARAG